MWRTRKWADWRSALSRWRVASRVGCRRSDDMAGVKDGFVACGVG